MGSVAVLVTALLAKRRILPDCRARMRPETSTDHLTAGFASRLHPLERRLQLRAEALVRHLPASPMILIACSGGGDSVALAEALIKASARAQVRVTIAHVHHGAKDGTNDGAKGDVGDLAREAAREAARDLARDLAREAAWRLAERHRVPFVESTAQEAQAGLHSEAELRAFRYGRLLDLKTRSHAHVIALAHHADDLLETRLIRLIRGTGPEGLEAMREYRPPLWRPLLKETKRALIEYCEVKQLTFVNDPSNANLGPLRNWIRQKWLPDLEEKRPGSTGAMARSLELFAHSFSAIKPMVEAAEMRDVQSNGIASIVRTTYRNLSEPEQARSLTRLLHAAGSENVTSGRALEAQKRLRSTRRCFEFVLGGVQWKINAEQITARSLE